VKGVALNPTHSPENQDKGSLELTLIFITNGEIRNDFRISERTNPLSPWKNKFSEIKLLNMDAKPDKE
jgi:hypothetical protein